MIFAGSYSTFTCSALFPTSNLVGTIGVRVIDLTGNTLKSRQTSGIVEAVSGSGFYVATIDLTTLSAAPPAGHYYVFWDDGATTPGHVEAEDLMIGRTTTLSAALRAIGAASASHGSQDIAVGMFFT